MKTIATIGLIILTPILSIGQSFDSKKIDSLFQLLEQHNKFMGSIAVSHNGKTIYANSIGYVDVENKIKANSQTKYRIGSISKMFTAALVLKAVEGRKLELNQTIEKYFPKIENASRITIKNLLNHSSGIHDFTRDNNYLEWNTIFQSKKDMIERISNFESDFSPNTKNEYSNSNFVLLTFILEDIYNQPFKKILNEQIIKPLNLRNTYYGGKIKSDHNEAFSYSFLGKWNKEKETNMSIPQGAGGIVSNPTDLNTFIEQLFLGNIISNESLHLMTTIKNGYGLGVFQFPYNDKTSYGHTGGIDGFQSVTSYFPNGKLAISLCSNGTNYDWNKILLAVLDTFYNHSFDLPNFETIELTADDLGKYLGTYSSEQIPPKIIISKKGNILIAQATGQSAFPLEAVAVDVFTFERADVRLEFNSKKNEMTLEQGGKKFLFKKE